MVDEDNMKTRRRLRRLKAEVPFGDAFYIERNGQPFS